MTNDHLFTINHKYSINVINKSYSQLFKHVDFERYKGHFQVKFRKLNVELYHDEKYVLTISFKFLTRMLLVYFVTVSRFLMQTLDRCVFALICLFI